MTSIQSRLPMTTRQALEIMKKPNAINISKSSKPAYSTKQSTAFMNVTGWKLPIQLSIEPILISEGGLGKMDDRDNNYIRLPLSDEDPNTADAVEFFLFIDQFSKSEEFYSKLQKFSTKVDVSTLKHTPCIKLNENTGSRLVKFTLPLDGEQKVITKIINNSTKECLPPMTVSELHRYIKYLQTSVKIIFEPQKIWYDDSKKEIPAYGIKFKATHISFNTLCDSGDIIFIDDVPKDILEEGECDDSEDEANKKLVVHMDS
jgi:hypothetical protein